MNTRITAAALTTGAAAALLASCGGSGTTVNQPSTPAPTTSASAAAAAHVGATLTLNGTDSGEKLQVTLVKVVDPSVVGQFEGGGFS
jgi:uncharacterized lipoprotein YajG